MTPTQFTCEQCGSPVSYMDAGLPHYEHRNQCPQCLWSKHIMFGTPTLKPCDAPMRPVMSTIHYTFYTTVCDGCGFRWVTYNENLWATLEPDLQTCWINMAWEETQLLNGQPTIIYTPAPQYLGPPPPIPPDQLGTRPRVKQRP